MFSSCQLALCIAPWNMEHCSMERCGIIHQTPLRHKKVPIDHVKCFDQFANLKHFIQKLNEDDSSLGLLTHEKWALDIQKHSRKLFRTSETIFAIPYRANVERVLITATSMD